MSSICVVDFKSNLNAQRMLTMCQNNSIFNLFVWKTIINIKVALKLNIFFYINFMWKFGIFVGSKENLLFSMMNASLCNYFSWSMILIVGFAAKEMSTMVISNAATVSVRTTKIVWPKRSNKISRATMESAQCVSIRPKRKASESSEWSCLFDAFWEEFQHFDHWKTIILFHYDFFQQKMIIFTKVDLIDDYSVDRLKMKSAVQSNHILLWKIVSQNCYTK